jgi:hypothetical protein
MIAATAVAVDGLRGRLGGSSFNFGQPIAAIVGVLALLAPVLSAAWFAGGLDMVVRRAPESSVPAFVAADSESPQAPRTLVIDDDAAGRVRYALLNGPGPQLGDAETGPPASDWERLDPYIAAMASGRGGDEIDALAGYGIRYIVLARATSRDLIPTLDGEPGLRRLSSSGGEVLWRVAGTTSRARLVVANKQTPVGIAEFGTTTADPYIDQALPDGVGERTLVIGATADADWQAVSTDGSQTEIDLAPVAGPGLLSWSQGFKAPEGTPDLIVRFDSTTRVRWLWLEALALLALVVMALPERRREDPDPDVDDDAVTPGGSSGSPADLVPLPAGSMGVGAELADEVEAALPERPEAPTYVDDSSGEA